MIQIFKNKFYKFKKRAQAEKKTALEEEAQMNRVKFGRTRRKKKKDENDQQKSGQFFSDHKLEKNIPQKKLDQEG